MDFNVYNRTQKGTIAMTDVIKRLELLMKQRGWTAYRLAKETGLIASTISNIFRRNTIPSIPTLETICEAFGITLAQFFAEDWNMVELTPEQKALFDRWVNLTPQQKELLERLIYEFK